MSTKLVKSEPTTFDPNQDVEFSVNDSEIERHNLPAFLDLRINGPDDKEGYERVHKARMTCVKLRSEVERQRKEYKAAALEYGRRVDSVAKQIVSKIEPVERHLVEEENAYKAEIERIKREAEEAKRRALQERLDKLTAVGCQMNPMIVQAMSDEDFSFLLDDKTKIHRERLEKEAREAAARKAEQERLEAEKKRLQEERDRIETERRALQAEKERLAREERERQEAERQRQEAIRRQQELEAAQELERQQQQRSDQDKLLDIAQRVWDAADGVEVSEGVEPLLHKVRKMCRLRADALRLEINQFFASDEEE